MAAAARCTDGPATRPNTGTTERIGADGCGGESDGPVAPEWDDGPVADVDVQEIRIAGRPGLLMSSMGALLVLALLVAMALYFRVGWWRMESACSLDDADGSSHNSVSYGWSWRPLGFRCSYDNGKSETSLWF